MAGPEGFAQKINPLGFELKEDFPKNRVENTLLIFKITVLL
jgi:hypothetical protein